MLKERWTRVVRVLFAVTALVAVSDKGVHTAAALPGQTHITHPVDAEPHRIAASSNAAAKLERQALRPSAGYRAAGAMPQSLAELLATQERSRATHSASSAVAAVCAAAIPGVLLGIAFWFAVLWFWNRDDFLPACVAGICSAASIATLAAAPESADLLPHFFTSSILIALEAASIALIGLFSLLLLYLIYPSEVTTVRIGGMEIKPPEASANESASPPSEWRRQVNTAILLGAMLVLGLAAAAAFIIPPSRLVSLFRFYDVLSLLLAVGVGVILAGVVRRRLPFAAILAAAYGILMLVLAHDVLVRSDVLWGTPAASYAFAPFLGVIGWATIGHSLSRWKWALERASMRERELEKLHSEVLADARALESTSRMQQRFVASTSHELRSPLTSILGFTELLEDELAEDLSPSHRGFLQSLRESAYRMLSLVNDLLDLARADESGLEMRLSAVDVDDVVDDAVRHIYPSVQVKRLAIYLEKEQLGARAWADASRLRQVVINLLSNAVKFTGEGQILIRVRSATLRASDEPGVAIEVEDTGRGISTDFMPKLFERFAREDEEAYEGTGLGLTISKEFIEAMGGEITVESRLRKGSRFTIILPAVSSSGGDPQRTSPIDPR